MTTKKRGFASMDPAKQREIASKGGKAAHQKGTAHEFTPEEAREAGRKGGQAAHGRGTAHKFTSEEAREAGRKGGRSARSNATAQAANTSPNGNAGAPLTTPTNMENTNATNANDMNLRSGNPEMSTPMPALTPGPTA
jgi:general stress protein YciG